jgi:hypothetical protein
MELSATSSDITGNGNMETGSSLDVHFLEIWIDTFTRLTIARPVIFLGSYEMEADVLTPRSQRR